VMVSGSAASALPMHYSELVGRTVTRSNGALIATIERAVQALAAPGASVRNEGGPARVDRLRS
jgi:hypothetical protein